MKSFFFLVSCFFVFKAYAIDPKKSYIATPEDYNIQYREFTVSKKNIHLYGWVSDAKIPSNNTVILAYADYGNMSYYLPYIKFYTDMGFNVISFDYRGFGKSSEFPINRNSLFYLEYADDLSTIVDYVKKELKIENVGMVSLSMGTVIAAISLQEKDIDFLIAEGCVYSLQKVVLRLEKIKNKKIILPNYSSLPQSWKNLDAKILIFSATNDMITTIEDAYDIAQQSSKNRKVVKYEGNHLGILSTLVTKELYKKQIQSFLKNE